MGVRGLSSFFDQNPSLFRRHKLYNTTVVIDGNNLVHMLYFSQKVDCVYGGDYNKFADVIKKYFGNFLECNIKPVVVFDGCYDKTDRKLATVLERAKQRLTNVQHIAKYGMCPGKVLPILAMEVTKDILGDMGITCIQCDFEADDQITALANFYQCSVISQDSDFYIFDIICGFIKLDSIESTLKQENDNAGQYFKYLECQIYFIDNFLSSFPGIDKSVLPLFGTLIGNDFVHINTFDNFFSNIQLPKFKHKLKVTQRHKKMIGLLAWLKNHTLEDAVNSVLNHLKMNKREQVRCVIDQAVSGYMVQNCCHCCDTSEKTVSPLFWKNNSLTTFYGSALPDWFVQKSRAGEVSPLLLNAMCLHRAFLPMQVEDVAAPSSFACSQYIRQVIYGILLSYDLKDSNNNALTYDDQIQEYDRCHGRLQKDYVKPLFSIEGFGTLPRLDELIFMDRDRSSCLMAKVIGDEIEYFMSLPSSFQILIGSIRFWLRNCLPKASVEFFYGLIVHIIYYTMVQSSAFNSDAASSSACSLYCTIRSIKPNELDYFACNMKKYHQKPQHNNANPFIVRIVHSFSQLQTCILCLLYLNNLLGSPFAKTKVHDCFGGTVLYNLTRDLISRQFPELFVFELLGRNSALCRLFTELKDKMLENILPGSLLQQEGFTGVKKKKKKHLSSGTKLVSTTVKEQNAHSSLCNSFTSLQLDEVDVLL